MTEPERYDVFLSHNSKDRPLIEQLAICLTRAGLRVWLDQSELVPGKTLHPQLAKALNNSDVVAVFIGPSGISDWQDREIQAADQIHGKNERVIPVLLPNAKFPILEGTGLFLSNLVPVDFRSADDLCEHEAFPKLLAAIRDQTARSESVKEGGFVDPSVRHAWTHRRKWLTGIGCVVILVLGTTGLFIRRWMLESTSYSYASEAEGYLKVKPGIPRDYDKAITSAVKAVEAYPTTRAKEVLLRTLVPRRHIDYMHPQDPVSAKFSPDGAYILTVGKDKIARIWSVVTNFGPTFRQIYKPFHQFPPVGLAKSTPLIKSAFYSKDGSLILTINEKDTIQVWDTQTGELLPSRITHSRMVTAAISPDNRQIVTVGEDQVARVWEVMTGQMLSSFKHAGNASHAEFSPDGKYLLMVCDETGLWDSRSYKPLRRLGKPGSYATFSSDGKFVITITPPDGKLVDLARDVSSWNVETGEQIFTDQIEKNRVFLARTYDGDIDSTGKLTLIIDNGAAVLEDLDNNVQYEIQEEINGRNLSPMVDAKFSPDGGLLLVVLGGELGRSVRLYECDVCGPFEKSLIRAKERSGTH
jgi:WD40 repeat protein